MQIEAHFQDLARPVVHVASTDTKRSLRWSSRALWWWKTPSHLMPRFGTSLLFMWSGEAGNRQSPAQFTVRNPTLSSSKNNVENTHPRQGWQQAAPWKKHRVVLRLHTLQVVSKSVLHLPLHFGGLELFLCPSHLHDTEVLPDRLPQRRCTVGLTVMLGHVQSQGQIPLTAE